MVTNENLVHKENIDCPICNSNKTRNLGIRGNREYFGADTTKENHIFTNVVQCMTCDFIYTNPMIRGLESLENDHYNNPDEYSAVEEDNPTKMFRKRLTFLTKYKKTGRVLDVGSGKGEFLFEAVKGNWEAVGIEPSEEFCEFAQKKYKVKMFHGSLEENNEIEKSYFDVVTMNHVLEHVERPQELLNLISCYLAEGGMIFIEVPNADSYFLRIIDIYFKFKKLNWSSRLSPLHPPFHKYGYTKQSIKYLLDKCGYKVVAIKTFIGKDRGYKKKKEGSIIEALLRDLVSTVINLLGNRELLCVIAKPINYSQSR